MQAKNKITQAFTDRPRPHHTGIFQAASQVNTYVHSPERTSPVLQSLSSLLSLLKVIQIQLLVCLMVFNDFLRNNAIHWIL